MKHSRPLPQFNILGFFVAIFFLNACNLFNKMDGDKVETIPIQEKTLSEENTLNEDSVPSALNKTEENIKDYISDAAIMANIKSFHSINSSIVCEIVLYVIPNKIEKDIPIDFLIANDSFTEFYFDTTLFLNNSIEGVVYNQERNFYEINLGSKKIGKNFMAKVELPHLSEKNSINISPNQFETIFMNR